MIRTSMRGMAAVEFVLAVPAFLLLLLLSVEFTLMAIDRHLLTNALFSATRLVLATSTSEGGALEGTQGRFPQGLNPMDIPASGARYECSQATRQRVRRHVAFKMAPAAVTPAEFAAGLGVDVGAAAFALPTNLLADMSPGAERLLKGYVPALLQVQIVQCYVDAQGAHLEINWRRIPRVPYAGTVVWAMHWLGTFNSRVAPALRLDLDDLFFGVKLSSPALRDARGRMEKLVGVLRSSGFKIDEMARAMTQDPLLADIVRTTLGTVATGATGASQAAEKGLTDAMARLDTVENQLHAQEAVLTGLLYAIPPSLRIVPMKRSMRLAWGVQAMQRQDTPAWKDDGANLLLAPYTAQSGSDDVAKLWAAWHEGLALSTFDDHPEGRKK